MTRAVLTILLLSAAFAQSAQQSEIVLAAKSPLTLARYVESHKKVDWTALRTALGLRASEFWFAPCGGDASANQDRCLVQTESFRSPQQTILIIQSLGGSIADEYLRYLRGPNGEWKFVGENSANKRFGPSNHTFVRLGIKPFLKISSDHSQNGVAIGQKLEDWFDLTLPGFEPVFSFTPEGNASGFNFTIGRELKARSSFRQSAGVECIDVSLQVTFQGRRDWQGSYVGVYERHANERNFTLRTAYSGLDRHVRIPTKDFEDLADPLTNPAKATFLRYALPGLKKIASESDPDDREWLRGVLDHADDTPEKRILVKLLAKLSK